MTTLMAIDVAKYVINKCVVDSCPISNLQLQKILYYLQVYFLQKKGEPLFMDEIEAWQFGPVVHEVYGQYCGYGSLRIMENYNINLPLPRCDIQAINSIIVEKRKLNPWDLVNETHAKGKAWDYIYGGGFGNGAVIPMDLMIKHG